MFACLKRIRDSGNSRTITISKPMWLSEFLDNHRDNQSSAFRVREIFRRDNHQVHIMAVADGVIDSLCPALYSVKCFIPVTPSAFQHVKLSMTAAKVGRAAVGFPGCRENSPRKSQFLCSVNNRGSTGRYECTRNRAAVSGHSPRINSPGLAVSARSRGKFAEQTCTRLVILHAISYPPSEIE